MEFGVAMMFDRVQFEKAKAMVCYNRLGSGVAKVLFAVEVLGAVVTLYWLSSRLPLALLFFRSFCAGHAFCFVLSNLIIITLLTTSLSSQPHNSHPDLYMSVSESVEEMVVPFEDKEMIMKPVAQVEFDYPKGFRRSKSAKYCSETTPSVVERGAVLRRSETKTYRSRSQVVAVNEEMSNEEFQRTIEDFIAKQLKFRRQESISRVADHLNT